MIKKKGAETSKFGTPGRVSHDASRFHSSRLYEGLPGEKRVDRVEDEIPLAYLDKIICKTSKNMTALPENSVHLMATFPPYDAGKEYGRNLTLQEYRDFLKKVWREVYRVLVPGGRACINIANLGRKPYISLHAFIIEDMLELGFLMIGEIIWDKGTSASLSTAWGSWMSPKNPTLRDIHEYILVFSRDTFRRQAPKDRRSTIERNEFLEFTKSVWSFPAVSTRKINHPAPFPIELPYRCIRLYTFEGEIVLDPFIGSGQTARAVIKTNRHFVGYEIDVAYVNLAEKR